MEYELLEEVKDVENIKVEEMPFQRGFTIYPYGYCNREFILN